MTTIAHTNGQIIFTRTKKDIQERVQRRFILPENEPYLYLDAHERPFVQRPNQPRMMCTLRANSIVGNGFHNHYVQK